MNDFFKASPQERLTMMESWGNEKKQGIPVGARAIPEPMGRVVKPVRGSMNGLEKRYSRRLDERILAQEVVLYYYESWKFRLADGSWYTPDFAVLLTSGHWQIHEVKGHMREAANVRLKVTSELYWSFPVYVVTEKRGIFTLKEVGR